MKRLPWIRNPDIKFWIDNDPVRLYYGIDQLELEWIETNGIRNWKSRWVSLSLEPNTALLKNTDNALVMVIDLPTKWMMEHMDQRLGGNREGDKRRLLDRELYNKWIRPDFEYYAGLQIYIANFVPERYITGFMKG